MFKSLKGPFLVAFSLFHLVIYSQSKTVLLEPQKRRINQGDPLPSQNAFEIQVPVNEETGIIRINLFRGKDVSNVIDDALWVRPSKFTENLAEMPISVRLHNNSTYGFQVFIYDLLSDSERTALLAIVHRNLLNYLDAT